MKKLLAVLALVASTAFGATLTPIQLLNPTGSTSGQAIISTGSSSAPGWGTAFSSLSTNSASPVTITNTATSGASLSLVSTSNTSNGATITMTGNGATTPAKSLRVLSGNLQVVNNANSSAILTLTDAGALSVSSSIAPSTTAGIIGTTAGDNANAGSVGEYATNTTSATSLTTTVYANATSVSLTAGDWDVSCSARFNSSSATFTQTIVGVGTTSATLPSFGQFVNNLVTYVANSNQVVASPTVRISIASTTTTYCVATAAFSSGTATVDGFIRARRVR